MPKPWDDSSGKINAREEPPLSSGQEMLMAGPTLKLLVLKTPQVERLRAFYQALGVELAEERHGKGPVHYAGQVGDAILEVYPLLDGGPADTTTRLGFAVEGLAEVVQALRDGGAVVASGPQQTGWGLRAVVHDPDGRAVELYETQPSQPSREP